ncbi:hypothetical protein JHK86_028643 [Glycine max]|nr:hypothetical protein JHK86_028643 [Glycine max]
MSRLRLGKKLQPAKKAWKSFSNKVQSKVQKLNIPKAIKATFKRLLASLHSLHHLLPSRARHRRPLASNNYHVHSKKNISVISIDDLFTEPASSSSSSSSSVMNVHAHAHHGETSRSKEVKKDLAEGISDMNTIEDAWKALVAKSPQLQVDQKAEEFISKFRQDMRLQKERSLLEFQEMLARGKKFDPAKKTWKRISNKVQSKVHKLYIPKAIEATFKRLITILHTLPHLIPSRDRRSLSSKKNISSVRIDNLFCHEPSCSCSSSVMNVHAHAHQEERSRGKEVMIDNGIMDTIEDAWKALVAKTNEMQVDQKAEEFISKFREEMRLQKERSLQEFMEMLARGC